MAIPVRQGYSGLQIGLHWVVALLIAAQFLFHDPMEEAWDAVRDGLAVPESAAFGANMHAAFGALILLLALARIYLRVTRGGPDLPANEPAPLKLLAKATHGLIYLLIVGLPLGGMAAWLGGVKQAAQVHGLGAEVLFWLVVLHVAGALVQQFVFKTNIMSRMTIAEK